MARAAASVRRELCLEGRADLREGTGKSAYGGSRIRRGLRALRKKLSSTSTRAAVAARHLEAVSAAACASGLFADRANCGVWLLPLGSVGIAKTGSMVGITVRGLGQRFSVGGQIAAGGTDRRRCGPGGGVSVCASGVYVCAAGTYGICGCL